MKLGYSKLPTSDLEAPGRRSGPSVSNDSLAEQRNQEMTEALSDKVQRLKMIASDIHGETNDQTFRMLGDTEVDLSRAQAFLGSTVNRLNVLVTKISTKTTCRFQLTVVLALVVVFFILYVLITQTSMISGSSESTVKPITTPNN